MPKNKKQKKKTQKRLGKKSIALIVAASVVTLALLITAGVLIFKHLEKQEYEAARSHALDAEPPYSDGTEVFDRSTFEIKEKVLFDKKTLLTNAKNMDESKITYQMIIQGKKGNASFEMNYWTEDEKGHYEYIFGGYDMGIDLGGYYYRTVIDAIPTVIDYQTGEYITAVSNTEFFTKYHNKLGDLTHDNLVGTLLSGEFTDMGKNANGGKVLIGDKVKVCVYDEGENPVVMILDESGDEPVGYYMCYGMPYAMPNIDVKE